MSCSRARPRRRADRPADLHGFRDQSVGGVDPPAQPLAPSQAAERDRQRRERALLAREPDPQPRNGAVALEVEEFSGRIPDHPEQLQARLPACVLRLPLHRCAPPLHGGRVAALKARAVSSQEQACGRLIALQRGVGVSGARDVVHPGAARELLSPHGGFKGLHQRLGRQPRFEIRERRRCIEQQGGSLTALARGKPDGSFESHRLSAPRRVGQPACTQLEQVLRLVAQAGGEIGRGRKELSQGLKLRIGRKLGGAFQEGGRCGHAAALLSAIRRPLQLAGDLFVGSGCRRREMPRAAVGLELGLGCVRERPVDRAPVGQRR